MKKVCPRLVLIMEFMLKHLFWDRWPVNDYFLRLYWVAVAISTSFWNQ